MATTKVIFPKYVERTRLFLLPNVLLKSLKETSWKRLDGSDLFKRISCVQYCWMMKHAPAQIIKIPKFNTIGKYTGKVKKVFPISRSSSTTIVNVVVLFMYSSGRLSLSSNSPHCLSSFVTNKAMKKPAVEINLFCTESLYFTTEIIARIAHTYRCYNGALSFQCFPFPTRWSFDLWSCYSNIFCMIRHWTLQRYNVN